MTKGLFITFEGGEGAGKSTLVTKLEKALKEQNRTVVVTREPGGTLLGEELRNIVLHRKGLIAPNAELFIFLASRIQHLEEKIKPALKQGAIVLCDRFTDSSIAYQGEARGLGMDYVATVANLAVGGFTPDITFYVDIDPKLGLLRMQKRGNGADRLERESPQFHTKVREGFQKLAKAHPSRIHTLDGTLSPDAIFDTAFQILEPHLKHASRRF